MKRTASLLILFIFFPLVSSAQFISEINYDLDGSDAGREWIEVYNDDGSFNITSWRFFEAEVNHTISLVQGEEVIDSGETAIIADNAAKFLEDNPGFSGNLFDSSFSLSNIGETLILKDSDLNEIFSVSYSSDWGAAGDGQTLQFVDGSWTTNSPSPGSYSGFLGGSSPAPTSGGSESQTAENSSEQSSHPVTPQIKIIASGEKNVVVGAHALYEAQVFGLKGDLISNARVIWNFGDGTFKEGERVLHNFKYPGVYAVVADASSGEFSASAKIIVEASPSAVLISGLDDKSGEFIKIRNDSDEEINLSWWIIKGAEQTFDIPENTFILPGSEIILSRSTTDIDARQRPLEILYPNGLVAYSFTDFNQEGIKLSPVGNSRGTSERVGGAIAPAPKDSVESSFQANEELAEENLLASPSLSLSDEPEKESSKTLWYVLFFLLLFLSAGIAILARRKIFNKNTGEGNTISARDIEIIE